MNTFEPLFLLLANVPDWDQVVTSLEHLAQPRYLVAGAIVVLAILILWFRLRRQPKSIMAYEDNTGSVYISTQALMELVRATCSQIPGISRSKVRIRIRRNTMHLRVHLRLESGSRIREIREHLKARLRQTLQHNLGLERLGGITVVVDEYKPGPQSMVLEPAPRPAPRPEDHRDETVEVEEEDEIVGPEKPDDLEAPPRGPEHRP